MYHYAPSKQLQSHSPPIPMNPSVFIAPTLFQWVSPLPLSIPAGGSGAFLGSVTASTDSYFLGKHFKRLACNIIGGYHELHLLCELSLR